MAGNSFGEQFKITTFGESHGKMIGVVIDGCPAGLKIDYELIQHELDKRKPGQSSVTSARKEEDTLEIVSGIYEGFTTGTPLTILIPNEDTRSEDYEIYKDVFRPSHADYTYFMKYGIRDYRGGGRSSARETVARVAAGAIAKQFLSIDGIKIIGYTSQIGHFALPEKHVVSDFKEIDKNSVRCPDQKLAEQMISYIEQLQADGDSIGGIVSCRITGCPAGLGEPVYDKLEANLAKAMMSINASKGFEIGSGFMSATMRGSEHNDQFFRDENNNIKVLENYAGGVLGGISTGADIYFRVAFKPTSTVHQNKNFINTSGDEVILETKSGRHDPCIVPRAVPVVEAMAAIVLCDHLLRNRMSKI